MPGSRPLSPPRTRFLQWECVLALHRVARRARWMIFDLRPVKPRLAAGNGTGKATRRLPPALEFYDAGERRCRASVTGGAGWLPEVKAYEKTVLAKRG